MAVQSDHENRTAFLTARLEEDLVLAFRQLARENERTISAELRRALRAHLEREASEKAAA